MSAWSAAAQHDYLVVAGDQIARECGADKPGPACQNDAFAFHRSGNVSVTEGKHAKAWTPNSAARCPRFSVPAVTGALRVNPTNSRSYIASATPASPTPTGQSTPYSWPAAAVTERATSVYR